jgi:undecaprenyl diphosphate synthase
MVLALSYSSRWEITRAARILADRAVKGEISPDDIDEAALSACMTTEFMPDPELLIRTGGELRLSNYLLWQSAYTELYFCDTFWPDFNMEELCKAIYVYQQRERRFGMTGAQVAEKKQNKTE